MLEGKMVTLDEPAILDEARRLAAQVRAAVAR
jgi:hypothetical protein